jgi:MULE transposase domain
LNFLRDSSKPSKDWETVILFANPEFLTENIKKFDVDATFSMKFLNFSQTLIFHTKIANRSRPFAYAFMTHKTKELYEVGFERLLEEFPTLAHVTEIMSDFEIGERNAGRKIWPNAR